jgi:hypothetical protein
MDKEIEVAANAYLEAMRKTSADNRVMDWFGLDGLAVNGIGLAAALGAVDAHRNKHSSLLAVDLNSGIAITESGVYKGEPTQK